MAEHPVRWLVMLGVAPVVAGASAVVWTRDKDPEGGWNLYAITGATTLTTVLCVAAWGVLNRGPSQGPAIAVLLPAAALAGLVQGPPDGLWHVYAGLTVVVAAGTACTTRGACRCRGEIWWAEVAFSDGSGAEDRPVLVVRNHGDELETLNSTSRDRLDGGDHIRLPTRGRTPEATHDSCLGMRPRTLETRRLRRYAGPCPVGVWRVVSGRTEPLVRTPGAGRTRQGVRGPAVQVQVQAKPAEPRPAEPGVERIPARRVGGVVRGRRKR